MFLKLIIFINKIKFFVNNKKFFLALIILNLLFVAINIYKQILILGILILIIDLFCILFFSKKYCIYEIFMLFPLARVLKLPGVSTSFVTISLIVLYVSFIIKFIINKKKLKQTDLKIIFLFALYFLFTLVVSLIYKNFFFNVLFSYYLYLFFPILVFVCIKKEKDINSVNNIILFAINYIVGFLFVIFFYNLIPGGNNMLKTVGVNVFDDGLGYVRYTPLTDDPNYGVCILILISLIFFISNKTNKQIKIGYPLIIISLSISILTFSKMYFVSVFIIFCCFLIYIIKKCKKLLLKLLILLGFVTVILAFCFTPLVQSLIGRFVSLDTTIDTITTGRSHIFGIFSSYILSNPLTLLFGQGPAFITTSILGFNDHNAFTSSIFGNGLFGITIIFILFFIMLKNRLDKTNSFPKNTFFYGFILCLLLCSMALSLNSSTVFPIFITCAQFANFKKIKTLSISINKIGENHV